jgi:cytochrome c peroxidase
MMNRTTLVALLAALCACNGEARDGSPNASSPQSNAEKQPKPPPRVSVPGDDSILAVDESGIARTVTPTGAIDTSGPFFQSLGVNGRACVSCHVATQSWTITPAGVRERFDRTKGLDPIFRTVDGSNSPLADIGTEDARRRAFSMLLKRGVIRIGIGIPAGAEFELLAVDDPYHFASAGELSLFRRPLPTASLNFLSTVMWDGRENLAGMTILQDLTHQSNTATQAHAQKVDPITDDQRAQLVAFETGIFFAQELDFDAGLLNQAGAKGGAVNLSKTAFHIGINDTLGADPTGQPFDPVAMTLYDAWAAVNGHGPHEKEERTRIAVARGQALFNTKPIQISDVRGLNDTVGVPVISGTCTTCHNTPDVGDHSVALPLDIGLTDASRRTPDMPLYTLRNLATGELYQTTDPGKALISGKWKDRSRFKGPILRGLAARAPYFHNGFAASLSEVVDFYQTRFAVGFTPQEKSDLEAFLRTL